MLVYLRIETTNLIQTILLAVHHRVADSGTLSIRLLVIHIDHRTIRLLPAVSTIRANFANLTIGAFNYLLELWLYDLDDFGTLGRMLLETTVAWRAHHLQLVHRNRISQVRSLFLRIKCHAVVLMPNLFLRRVRNDNR